MLSRDGVIARYIFAFCFFFISGTQMITGWPATISGVLGTVELATAFLRYSPFYELADYFKSKAETQRILLEDKTK